MEDVYTLKNWYFEKVQDKYRVWGNVSGSDNFQDGQWIHTSKITDIKIQWGALLISTENSSYFVKYNEHDPSDKRVLRRALRDFIWPDDSLVYSKIEQSEKRKQIKVKPSTNPDDYKNCAILTFSDNFLNLFVSLELRRGKKRYKRVDYDIQTGLYDDVWVMSDPQLEYEFKFFPYAKNAFQFEEWKGRYSPVFIRNTGNHTFYASTMYGDFEIHAGETVLISMEKSEDRMYTTLEEEIEEINDKTTIISHASNKMKK